jgi:hypothetical protein
MEIASVQRHPGVEIDHRLVFPDSRLPSKLTCRENRLPARLDFVLLDDVRRRMRRGWRSAAIDISPPPIVSRQFRSAAWQLWSNG